MKFIVLWLRFIIGCIIRPIIMLLLSLLFSVIVINKQLKNLYMHIIIIIIVIKNMFFISIKRLSMQNVGNVHTKKCHCDLSKFWYG